MDSEQPTGSDVFYFGMDMVRSGNPCTDSSCPNLTRISQLERLLTKQTTQVNAGQGIDFQFGIRQVMKANIKLAEYESILTANGLMPTSTESAAFATAYAAARMGGDSMGTFE